MFSKIEDTFAGLHKNLAR